MIYDHLLQTRAGEPILPVGFSIGAAVAAYLARHRPVAGLILVTPFNSLEAVVRDLYWWAPVGPLLRNRMPTIEFVRGSNIPTALIIAQCDTIAPERRSTPLRTAIRNLVFERSIDAGHNDLYDHPNFREGGARGAHEGRGDIGRDVLMLVDRISHWYSAGRPLDGGNRPQFRRSSYGEIAQ